jgi:hypothetical protein
LRTVLDLASGLSREELQSVFGLALDRQFFDLPTLRRAADAHGAEAALAVERAVAALRGDPFPAPAAAVLAREAAGGDEVEKSSEDSEISDSEGAGEDGWRQW